LPIPPIRTSVASGAKRTSIDDYVRTTVPSVPFDCLCGEVLDNPCDQVVMAVHQPHYLAAKAAKPK
jgi:hypothetical protein